ncbi:uncharacterized protein LOC133911770 [Phragmites australis]|uniref:uncharacterized protein LOC133911770 n=1 Tax=Phragmites australis TaxID=29695 RepID=UPI002D789444|nr:uncharacterized protein LOC133911770 [Phragmites australis]
MEGGEIKKPRPPASYRSAAALGLIPSIDGSHAAPTRPSHLRSIDQCRSMGSGKVSPGAVAGASGPPPGAVCCMCGDRGLLPELFRCSACSVRSQHTYCTYRYPKAESYGTCNWCLRADGGVPSTSNSPRSAGKAAVRPAAQGDTTGGVGGGSGRSPKVAARGDFASSNLSKPIKKQQQRRLLLRGSASDLGSRVRADHDDPPSPGVARGRPRVRRYKLLEEVMITS